MIKKRFKEKEHIKNDFMDFPFMIKEDFDLELKKTMENTIKTAIKDTYEEAERAITNIENLINKL